MVFTVFRMNRCSRSLLTAATVLALAVGLRGQIFPTAPVQPASFGVGTGETVIVGTTFQFPPGSGSYSVLRSRIRVRILRNGVELLDQGLTISYGGSHAYSLLLIDPNPGVGTFWREYGGANFNSTGTLTAHLTIERYQASDAGSYQFEVLVDGHVYVADEGNNSIRVVTPTGGVGTKAVGKISGSSAIGAPERQAETAASALNGPKGVAVDSVGNLYIADTANNVIRLLTPDGMLSILAGTVGVVGNVDGTGSTVRFGQPTGIALDGAGNVYVSDVQTYTIRKITPAGVVSTLAGSSSAVAGADGVGSAAGFFYPYSLAVDSSGSVDVADSIDETIRKITPTGTVTTLAGATVQDGIRGRHEGAAARFNFPCCIAIDPSGNLFVTDDINNTIREVTPAGVVTTIAGTAGTVGSADGTGAAARFNYPYGIVIDSSGNLIVSDNQNHTLRKIAPGGVVTTLAGSPGTAGSVDAAGAAAQFNNPYGLAYGTLAIPTTTATLATATTPPVAGRLSNLSVRTATGGSNGALTVGFFVGGTGSKRLLVRADGPTLAQFGVTGVLPDPLLNLYQSASGGQNTLLGSDAGWGGSTTLSAAFTLTGAFTLPLGSLDSALLNTVPVGGYSAQVSSSSGKSGVALAEVYDADTSTPTARFINLSALAPAGIGAQVLTAGFVVSGSNPEMVLIRGTGPGLVPFGVVGTLSSPLLSLYATDNGQNTQLAENFGWTGDPDMAQYMAQVGAFALPANSADTAMLVSLAPGAYTAQVTSLDGVSTGTALIEVYEFTQ